MRTTQITSPGGHPPADRQCARSGLTQAAICLALALALAPARVARRRPVGHRQTSAVEPKVPVRDYPSHTDRHARALCPVEGPPLYDVEDLGRGCNNARGP